MIPDHISDDQLPQINIFNVSLINIFLVLSSNHQKMCYVLFFHKDAKSDFS